jgi:SAM-dependent methyltransferase
VAQRLIHDFVRELAHAVEIRDPIVEFGSLQVEPGQPNDLRPLFGGLDFIGTDMREGAGVDRVEDLRALSFADGEIGTAICLDTLEHCEDPRVACREMHRVLADGGLCAIASVMLFGIHGYPADYWRFTPEGFRALLEPFDDAWVAGIGDPDIPFHVVGVGAKGRRLELSLQDLPALAAAQERWERAEGQVRVGPFRMSLRELGGTLARELPRAVRQRATGRARARRPS